MNHPECSNWQAFSTTDHPRKQMKRNTFSGFLGAINYPETRNMKRIATMAKASSHLAGNQIVAELFADSPERMFVSDSSSAA
jgi:hypothetical protein